MSDPVLAYWRGILGNVPAPEKLGQLESLNAIPQSVVSAARQLGNVRSAVGFISSYLQPEQDRWVEHFVQEVVFGETRAWDWMRGRTLVPDWSFSEQVTLPPAALLGPLGGNFSHRVTPSLPAWEAASSWVGAPCLPQPEADYLCLIPERAAALGKDARIEDIENSTIALRRWIAGRIAIVVRSRVGMDFRDAEAAASSLVPIVQWTVDARAALQALLREAQAAVLDGSVPFGFRGPDDWFADPS